MEELNAMKTGQTFISIIIPVYNVELFVEDCIRSVMRQTYDGPMECIVVDDCGTDDSMAIVEWLIKEYTGPIEFIILHHTHNRGLSAARNTGIDAAKGDYFFFLDSDDELTDDCLEKLIEPLEKKRYDVVMGNVCCYKKKSSGQVERVNSYLELKIPENMELTPPVMMQTISIWKNMIACNRLFRKDFIVDNHLRFKEGMIYEDHLWSFQIACLASSFYVVNNITYHYKMRDGSISNPYDRRKYMESLMKIIKEMGVFVDNYNVDKAEILPVFKLFFYKVLNYHSAYISNFIPTYRELRPYIKAPIKFIIQANGLSVKKYLQDLHFMMPTHIAPYWQFWLCHKFCNAVVKMKNVYNNSCV